MGKTLEYSDKGIKGKNKAQKKIIKQSIKNEIEKESGPIVDEEKEALEWEQIENTLEDLFHNIENYDGHENFGQKKLDTRLLQKHMKI